ncbi:hypothetical protein ABIF90_001668 [Bradyrhizobium japonicum]
MLATQWRGWFLHLGHIQMEFFVQVILIVAGWAIPLALTWAVSQIPSFQRWLTKNGIWTTVLVSSLVSLFLTVSLVLAYDRHLLPFEKKSGVHYVTSSRDFQTTYQNGSRTNLVVSVSATNIVGPGNTMCGNVSDASAIPAGVTGNCHNTYTVADTSFAGKTFTASITFVVPPGFYYSVSIDGENVRKTYWTEYDF